MSFDLVDVFSGPAAAERGKGGPERSLRKMLARGFPLSQPRHGWRLAARRPAKALFIRGRLGAEFETPGFLEDIELERRGGRWQMSTAGDCHLAMVERGQFASGWSLAPRQPDLGPDTQSLWLITGARCSRKQKAPRFEPEFIEIGGRLVLTLWPHYEPEEGGGVVEACDPRVPPWPPVKIELPEPLGERGLYDGAFFPPLPADRYEPPRVIPL